MKNLVYFGSPAFSADILESIIRNKQVNIVGIVTTEDKPTGRKQILTPSALADLGEKYNLPVYKPKKLDDANLAHLKLLSPDIFLVVSYGKFIPENWLISPKIGTFNIHFSLLPKYRGALCISEPIKNGDSTTGVTLMRMDKELDHGPIIAQSNTEISLNDNVESLTQKLSSDAQKLLSIQIPKIVTGEYQETAQDESQKTITPSHKTQNRSNSFVSFEKVMDAIKGINSLAFHNLIRSQNPEPGSWTQINGIDYKILTTSYLDKKLQIETIQAAGKNPTTWKQFISNNRNLFR